MTLNERMICHQYKVREAHRLEEGDAPPVIIDSLRQMFVRRTTYQTAKPFIEKYEWLGRMSATRFHYGLFTDDFFDSPMAGVVCYGGTNCTGGSYVHRPWGVEYDELGVLARGACTWWCHPHGASFLIARSLKLLKQDSKYKLVIAYSDPSAGEIGTVYQATNWAYVGKTTSVTYRYRSPDGAREFSDASIIVEAQKRGLRWRDVNEEYLSNGWTKVPQSKKYRYVYLLDKSDKRLAQLIETMRQPYPKREEDEL